MEEEEGHNADDDRRTAGEAADKGNGAKNDRGCFVHFQSRPLAMTQIQFISPKGKLISEPLLLKEGEGKSRVNYTQGCIVTDVIKNTHSDFPSVSAINACNSLILSVNTFNISLFLNFTANCSSAYSSSAKSFANQQTLVSLLVIGANFIAEVK